jgi:hypothetical protein
VILLKRYSSCDLLTAGQFQEGIFEGRTLCLATHLRGVAICNQSPVRHDHDVVAEGVNRYLFGVSSKDATTLLASCAVMLIAGIVAVSVPAYRAAHVDPAVALRVE